MAIEQFAGQQLTAYVLVALAGVKEFWYKTCVKVTTV